MDIRAGPLKEKAITAVILRKEEWCRTTLDTDGVYLVKSEKCKAQTMDVLML